MPNIIVDRSNIKANGFCIIPRAITLDTDISPEAVGLYVKIYTFDEDTWDLSVDGLAKSSNSKGVTKAGKEKISRILNELIEHGYITRRKERTQGGKFGGYVYEIHDTPQIESEQPTATKAKAEVKHKHGEYKHVRLTESEYNKLVDEYGEELTAGAIKEVDEYVERSNKSYKNYYLVIKKWGVDSARKAARRTTRPTAKYQANPFMDMLDEGGF